MGAATESRVCKALDARRATAHPKHVPASMRAIAWAPATAAALMTIFMSRTSNDGCGTLDRADENGWWLIVIGAAQCLAREIGRKKCTPPDDVDRALLKLGGAEPACGTQAPPEAASRPALMMTDGAATLVLLVDRAPGRNEAQRSATQPRTGTMSSRARARAMQHFAFSLASGLAGVHTSHTHFY